MDLVKEIVMLKDEGVEHIAKEAKQAADRAQQDAIAQGHEDGYCGFGWVEVQVSRTNSREAKALEKMGFKKSWRPRRMDLWKPGCYNGQSMTIHEIGAQAYAEVLQNYGFKAYMHSRAD